MIEKNTQRIDYTLIYLILSLMTIGLTVIYAITSVVRDSSTTGIWISSNHELYTQLVSITISISIGFLALTFTKMSFWYRWSALFILICTIFLFTLDIGIWGEVNGAKRWISLPFLGMQVQPAEFAKLFLALFLISIINSPKIKKLPNWLKWFRNLLSINEKYEELFTKFIYMLGATMITAILIFKTVDFGSTVIVIGIFITVILCTNHFKFTTKALLAFICLICMGLLIHHYKGDSSSYRQQRLVLASKDPNGYGYQATHAEDAWSNSHFFNGTGLGNSKYRMIIPAYSNDYILAGVAEHFGFIPMFGTVMIYILIIFRSFQISHSINQREGERERRQFSSMVCMVLPTIILMEVGIHFFTSLGLFPFKGLTLPFVSSGGSSMLMCTIIMVLIVRVNYETFHNTSTSNDKFYDYDYDQKTTI